MSSVRRASSASGGRERVSERTRLGRQGAALPRRSERRAPCSASARERQAAEDRPPDRHGRSTSKSIPKAGRALIFAPAPPVSTLTKACPWVSLSSFAVYLRTCLLKASPVLGVEDGPRLHPQGADLFVLLRRYFGPKPPTYDTPALNRSNLEDL